MSIPTIYHNPDCGTSRNTLALIRASGIQPTVIEYLKTPPDRQTLQRLLTRMGMRVRDVLRIKGTDDPALTDEQLIGHILSCPILLNRPIVVSDLGVALCRPSDWALGLLPQRPMHELLKEDGTPFLLATPIEGSDLGLAEGLQAAGLPADDLTEPERRFFAFETLSGERVGYGGFEGSSGPDVLVRSLVVLPQARHRGVGSGMLALLLRHAFDQGARHAWLLTTTAAAFFERAGFKPVARAAAPASILASRQATALCPASAVLLTRRITL